MPENIETKVAQTILQQPEEITVGDKVYKAAPPSAATLILASEAVARMPKIQLNTERIVDEVLAIGKDCRPMGEIVAIMILGAKGLTETRKTVKTVEKRRFWGLIKEAEQVEVEEVIDHKTASQNRCWKILRRENSTTWPHGCYKGRRLPIFSGLPLS